MAPVRGAVLVIRFAVLFAIPFGICALSLPVRAHAAGQEVRVGFERAIGVGLALDVMPGHAPLFHPCPDEGWNAAPPERAPAHRAAHPFYLRTEPRTCPQNPTVPRPAVR